MSFKITNPDAFEAVGNASLAHGSFELYKLNSYERHFASVDANLSKNAPFQNSLDETGAPIDHLWVDNPFLYTVVFRDATGAETLSTPLSSALADLNPLEDLDERVTNLEG